MAARAGEVGGLAAAELQRHRVLGRIEGEVALAVAEQDGAGVDHLGVEPGVRRQQAVEVAAVAVGPVHHRGDAEAPGLGRGRVGGHGRYVVPG